jgi:hypothetical protein
MLVDVRFRTALKDSKKTVKYQMTYAYFTDDIQVYYLFNFILTPGLLAKAKEMAKNK